MKLWVRWFFFPLMTVGAFSLFGTWHMGNVRFNIQEHVVTGTANHSIIQMDFHPYHDPPRLRNLRVVKRPSDWYNVAKYRDYISVFTRVLQEKEGIVCHYSFLGEDRLLVEPQIGKDRHPFLLHRVHDDEKQQK